MFKRGGSTRGVEERLVWIFGSPRSGTTWLLNLLAEHEHVVTIDEPGIGQHLGMFTSDLMSVPAASIAPDKTLALHARVESPDYFFARHYESSWAPALKELLLARFAAHLRSMSRRDDSLCVIKEPNGSQAAEILASLLPRARLLFLLRDGRDVLDSQLDAAQAGSWLDRAFGGGQKMGERERIAYLEEMAHRWLQRAIIFDRAYDRHPADLSLRIKYEDLLADPERHLATIVGWMGLSIDQAEIGRIVAHHSFDAVPAERKGSGEFARAASPGLWRTNLSAAEQEAVEAIIGPKLAEIGYATQA
jgi:Sulfotransferase family